MNVKEVVAAEEVVNVKEVVAAEEVVVVVSELAAIVIGEAIMNVRTAQQIRNYVS